MEIFLDCEFDGHKGKLLSMALVAGDGAEWYQVISKDATDQWVIDNVVPVLFSTDQHSEIMTLQEFLFQYEHIYIIADWPDDIKYFCEELVTAPGRRIDTPRLYMEIRRDIDSQASKIPHNALADARAIRDAYAGIMQG